MRIPRHHVREKPAVNVMPLLDMMFILIIFFLVTTQFQQEERDIQINLPETKAGETLSASASALIVINVRSDRDNSYVVRENIVTQDQLRDMLTKAVADNPDQKVLVRADKNALHGFVAAAISLCRHAGIRRANIGYELPR